MFEHVRAHVVADQAREDAARTAHQHPVEYTTQASGGEGGEFGARAGGDGEDERTGFLRESRQARPDLGAQGDGGHQHHAEGARSQKDVDGPRDPDRVTSGHDQQPVEADAGPGQRRWEEFARIDHRGQAANGRLGQQPGGDGHPPRAAFEHHDRAPGVAAREGRIEGLDPAREHLAGDLDPARLGPGRQLRFERAKGREPVAGESGETDRSRHGRVS